MLLNLIHISLDDYKRSSVEQADLAINRMVEHFCDGDRFIGDIESDFAHLHESIVEMHSSNSSHAIGYIVGLNNVYIFSVADEYSNQACFENTLFVSEM